MESKILTNLAGSFAYLLAQGISPQLRRSLEGTYAHNKNRKSLVSNVEAAHQ
jgi:hypothetical protein